MQCTQQAIILMITEMQNPMLDVTKILFPNNSTYRICVNVLMSEKKKKNRNLRFSSFIVKQNALS